MKWARAAGRRDSSRGRAPRSTTTKSFPRVLAARSAASPGSNDQDLANLRALGYLGGGEVTRAPAAHVGNTRTPASFNNEGLILEAQQRPDDAERAYAQALAIDPRSASAAWNLSHLLAERGREPRRADELLIQAVREGLPEGEKHVVQRAIAAQRGGDLNRAETLVGAALAARPDSLTSCSSEAAIESRPTAAARR